MKGQHGVFGRMIIGCLFLSVGSQVVAQQPTVAAHMPMDASADELLARRVTIHLTKVSLIRAIDSVSRVANVVVEYQLPLLSAHPELITLDVANKPLGVVLEQVLNGTALRVVPGGSGGLTIVPTQGSQADSVPNVGIVSGHVVDSATGQGLSGATIKVAGTKISTMTQDSGRFILRNVPAGDHLITVKIFAYRPEERTVEVVAAQTTMIRMPLVSMPTLLSGVVTTATGQQQRYQVGNDITVLNADSIQQIAPVSNVTQMLETRVPGLIVQHSTGIPGAPSRLRIRGVSSINSSSDPIVIVDGNRVYADQSGTNAATDARRVSLGVNTGGGSSIGGGAIGIYGDTATSRLYAGPSALDQIDPNSIETIEVLKGPSATAIYGSDAATGVIVITTKHGHAGPTRWSLNLDDGRTTLPGRWPVNWFAFGPTQDPPYSAPCDVLGFSSSGYNLTPCRDSLVSFQALNDPRYSPLSGQPGYNRDVSLTVSGGNSGLTYSVTGSASKQAGYLHLPQIEQDRFQLFHGSPAPDWMINPDQYTTWGGTSQLTAQLGKRGASVSLSSAVFRSAQQQSSLQSDLSRLSQMYVDTTQLAEQPLFSDYYTRAQLATTTFNNAVSLDQWAPWSWLPLSATAGLNVGTINNTSLLPAGYVTCAGNTYDVNCKGDSLGLYTLSQLANTVTSLTARTTLAQQRLISTAVGLNVYTTTQSSFSGQTENLAVGQMGPPFQFVSNDEATTSHGVLYNATNVATYGWFVVPTINLNSRFFASPGFRLDGGSASGENAQLNLFPKMDISYVALNRTPSDPLFGMLTFLRPRIAFGIAGVQPALGEQERLFTADPYNTILGTLGNGRSLYTIGNPNLHPERDRELEGGVDIAFGDRRLSLNLTGYSKTAYDAITSIPVAPSVITQEGGNVISQAKNIGTIRNTGIEATMDVRLIDRRAVSWSVNANMSKNRNVVVSLVAGQPPLVLSSSSGYQTRLTPGYPINGFWAAPIISYADADHNGFISANEVRVGDSVAYAGAPFPNYELAMSTTLAFFNNRLRITSSLDYQNGLTQLNNSTGIYNFYFSPTETLAQQAAVAAADAQGGGGTAIGFLQKVDVLRWNTISINFLVPSRVSRLVRIPSMSLALQGSNLGLHTNYQGADPNVNAFSSGNSTADTGQLPQPRVWSLRVSVGN